MEHEMSSAHTRFSKWLVSGAGLIVAAAAVAVPQAAHAAGSTVYLPDVLPGITLATLDGPAPANQTMRLDIAVNHPNVAGEQAAYTALYNPSSPTYHQFLTPAQYDAAFGVSQATATAVSSWLSGGGLDVFYQAPSNDLFEVSGTVAQIDALFQTTINRYNAGGISFLANPQEPAVPASLPIKSVIGLNTLQRFYTTTDQATERPEAVTTHATGTSPCDLVEAGICIGDYQPQDLWKVYDMPSKDEGQGQTLGIFMEGVTDSVVANLRVFEQRMNLPEVPVTVVPAPNPSDATGPTDNSGELEWDLDSDSSTGMAPLVNQLYYYDANSLFDADVATEFSKWADDPYGPLQMNASFGECETNPGNPITGGALDPNLPFGQGLGDNLEPVAEGTLEQAALEGRTLFASAGDTGGSCPAVAAPIIGAGNGIANEGYPAINYPCGSDFAVCVGGTVLYTNVDSNNDVTSRNTEYAWTHTGGGSALFIGQPDFQQKYLGGTAKPPGFVPQPCTLKYDLTTYPVGSFCRTVPDIAAQSGDVISNGYDTNFDMFSSASGGTSLSSPLSVGMWARIQAAAPLVKRRAVGLGFADETIYRVATGPHGTGSATKPSFTDITVGTNGQHLAATGYDETTGWGVFDVANFIADPLGDNNPTATPTAPRAQATVKPEPLAAACQSLFTTYAGNATDPASDMNDANLDITSASMSLSGTTLVARLVGPSLAPGTDPAGANGTEYYLLWTYAGTTYYGMAYVDPTGTQVFYNDGNTNSTSLTPPTSSNITGSFANGTLTLNVPLADVGNPPTGSVLSYPYGLTRAVNNPALVPFTVDTGGSQRAYSVGRACKTN
jgi:pseudomonalisin